MVADRICAICGAPVTPERLEAVPNTEYCTGCQCKIERRDARRALRHNHEWAATLSHLN